MPEETLQEQRVPARFRVRDLDIEVRGCRVVETDEDGTEHVQQDDENPQFYGVYRADDEGLMMHESDHATIEEAFDAAYSHGVFEYLEEGVDESVMLEARTLPEAVKEARALVKEAMEVDRTEYVEAIVRSVTPGTEEPIDIEDSITHRMDPEPAHEPNDWRSPHELLGGLKENPGVQGHGGGVIVEEIDANSGIKRITNTWDQGQGPEPVETIRYEDPTNESLEWAIRQHPLRVTLSEKLQGHEGVVGAINDWLVNEGFDQADAIAWGLPGDTPMGFDEVFVELLDEDRVSFQVRDRFDSENLDESVAEVIRDALDWPNVYDLVTAAHGPVETFRTKEGADAEWEKEVRRGTRLNMENGFSDETGTVENPTESQAREAAEWFHHVDERPATPDEIIEMGLPLRGIGTPAEDDDMLEESDLDTGRSAPGPSL